jgi:hypothetical protein
MSQVDDMSDEHDNLRTFKSLMIWIPVGLLLWAAIILPLACQHEDLPASDCYECTTYVMLERCDTFEYSAVTDSLKCGWSEGEIRQYEIKNTYSLSEKCFYKIQVCKCQLKSN